MLDNADTSPKLPSTFVTIVLPPQAVTSARATLRSEGYGGGVELGARTPSFDHPKMPSFVAIVCGGRPERHCGRVGIDVGTL